ncbi:phosphoglycerate dehydrogenase [Candidatus Pantoea edessiphila]|uniref:D-3-phosphoglycerate dehydrogenase n=1 Tax=Candidatus Pantoea edessiphila TaxID=2044610 RepID=A0A2P5SXJ7_9GAMM|nr:phosphoglycerate dehydrogenase [Candidatus Pantoea edessiphila]MBK4775702.1 phosphoglycerate dehydrogenase [Pantoea sp. Edef]PPI87067.1 phosphoglycerate dehydrogenase [Candidatus Pantoea edessiphila]
MEKDRIRFLLLEDIHKSAIHNLKSSGYSNIESYKTVLDSDYLKNSLINAHFIGIRSRSKINKYILSLAKNLLAIGCFCIGTDQIDLIHSAISGIPIFNAPFSNTRSVAELVIGEMLIMLRGVPVANAKMHCDIWYKTAKGSFEARGKKIGIIGYGHIGMQLGILAESLGMHVFFYDLENKLSLGNAIQVDNIHDLLRMSDVISIHVPETQATNNMISAKELSYMKSTGLLINTSRGNVVNLLDLYNALKDKKIAGAAIDVFPSEPINNSSFISSLKEFDNVILTPHIGGSTEEAQENIGIEVSSKLIKYFENGSTISAVNFPEVSLPIHKYHMSRFIHIHKNLPGILNSINQIFADHNVNIFSQYLQTSSSIGYVVIDANAEKQILEIILKLLQSIKGTIRTRLLY